MLLLGDVAPLVELVPRLGFDDHLEDVDLVLGELGQGERSGPVGRPLSSVPVEQDDLSLRLALGPVSVGDPDRDLLDGTVGLGILVDMASSAVGLALHQPGFLLGILEDHPVARARWGRLSFVTRIGVDASSEYRFEDHIAINDTESVMIVPLVGDARLGWGAAGLRVVLQQVLDLLRLETIVYLQHDGDEPGYSGS